MAMNRPLIPESDLIDEILLATGKALYLANGFESKCTYILRVANLADILQDDPVITLERAASLMPSKERLANTLRKLFNRADVSIPQEDVILLEKARKARNSIAHEGAGAIGELWSYDLPCKFEALRKLHAMVVDLAKGDGIVSSWVYRIEEPREPMPSVVDQARWIENWVFSHIPPEWLDPQWQPVHQPPRTVRAAVIYEPWYTRPCRCLQGNDD